MHADLEAVLARELAGFTVRTVRPLGAGVDNIAYEVNDELIVRFAAEPDHERRAEIVRREAQLLDVLRELSSLPVPEPVLASPDDGFLAYDKLPGVPLASLPGPQRVGPHFAATLAEFLTRLHSAPVSQLRRLVDVELEPLEQWLGYTRSDYLKMVGSIPPAVRRPIESFLAAAVPEANFAPAFCHNDLGAEHVLVDSDSRECTGILDWTDAAITDPARDFGPLYRDCGPTVVDAALAAYGAGPGLRERDLLWQVRGVRGHRTRLGNRQTRVCRERHRCTGLAVSGIVLRLAASLRAPT
jgi:aminoglycoside phosphotransferase (APT) family kinase protein